MNNDFKVTSVFNLNNNALAQGEDIIINQGGTRSGKTYSILQLLFLTALYSKKRLIISIVSRALPHLRLGAMRDFDNILLSWGIIPDNVKNRTESYYKIGNSVIEFFGADQSDKVHGPQRDILFVNEANFIKEEIFDQLLVRTEGTVFIDFNPTTRFWVHDSLMLTTKHAFIKTTYRDNECLPAKQVERIEAKRKNANWWRVYGEGEIGTLEGAILTNWRYGEFDSTLPFGFGLDYGFHPDPDAMLKCAVSHKQKKIYWHECIYETSQGTDDLITNIGNFAQPKNVIIAESATPRTNYDLKKYYNIKPVIKTKTVADWLRVMQDYEIVITEGSSNLEKELLYYLWSDKKAGVPLDDWNHLIDAGRYHFMMNQVSRRKGIKSSRA